ncbi:MAG: hypothetical protein ACNA8W_19155 [Bradymonadaceae bacterium]
MQLFTPSLVILVSTTVLLASCGEETVDDPDTSDGPSVCTTGEPVEISPEILIRTAESQATEFSVIFLSLQCDEVPDELLFRVDLTNHTGDIAGFDHDLDRSARLVTDTGKIVSAGLSYEILSADEHHPSGILRVPNEFGGQPLVDCTVGQLTLELEGVATPPGERLSFEWEGEVLDGLRSCP